MSSKAPNEASSIGDVQAVIRRLEAGTLSDAERDLLLDQLETAPSRETAVLAALVRQSFTGLYRYVGPRGELREHGERVLGLANTGRPSCKQNTASTEANPL
jgi:hypothetical protein